MARNQFDVIDMIAGMAFLLFGLLHLGAFEPGALSFLNMEIWTYSSQGWENSVTLAFVGSLVSFGVIIFTNDWQRGSQSAIQLLLVIVTLWLILSPPFMPIMAGLLDQQTAAMAAVAIQFATSLSVGYYG